MAKERRRRLMSVYRKFEDTDRILIEVSLDNYEDIFNEWDPAPFKRRDIDPDLQAFLDECSSEIALKYPIAIALYLPKREMDLEKQQKCIEGLHNFFTFNEYLTEKQLTLTYKNILKYLAIGLSFLLVAVAADHLLTRSVLTGVFSQGLFIGGWVFIWEALSTFAFKNNSLKRRRAEWKRFLDAPIVFKKERRAEQGLE